MLIKKIRIKKKKIVNEDSNQVKKEKNESFTQYDFPCFVRKET